MREALLALGLNRALSFDNLESIGVDPNAANKKSFSHSVRIGLNQRRYIYCNDVSRGQLFAPSDSKLVLGDFRYINAEELTARQILNVFTRDPHLANRGPRVI